MGLIGWCIFSDYNMVLLFPSRSFSMLALFVGLGLLQDAMCDVFNKKMSNFSWVFQSNDTGGMVSRRTFVGLVFCYCVVGFFMGLMNQWRVSREVHRNDGIPIVFQHYSSGSYVLFHC